MNKILTVILTLCICLTMGTALTACDLGTTDPEHTHTYETVWSSDTTHHWYACSGENCNGTSQKAEHTLTNDICSICGYAKIETIACSYTVVSAPMSEENGLYVMDSVSDGEYNYYLLDLGYAKNVPIWIGPSTYWDPKGGSDYFTFLFEEINETQVAKSVSNTLTKTVSNTTSGSASLELGIEFEAKKENLFAPSISVKGSVGTTYSRSWGTATENACSQTDAWSETQTKASGYTATLSFPLGGYGVGTYRISLLATCDIYALLETSTDNKEQLSITYSVYPRNSEYKLEYSSSGDFIDATVDKIELPNNYLDLLPEPERLVEKDDTNLIENNVDYAGGCGTEERPYLISTAQHLKNIEKNMSSHFKLTNDIDLSGQEWEPIGGAYLQNTFKGQLDGANYAVVSLTRYDEILERDNRSYFGLFGGIGRTGLVENIRFKSVDIDIVGITADGDMRAFHGVVAGKCSGGTIKNVTLDGSYSVFFDVEGEAWAAGVCGYAVNATISNCVNNIDIKVDRHSCVVSGIVGYAEGGTIENCTNYGVLSAIGYWDSWLWSWWSGTAYAAPICAVSHNSNPVQITNCVNEGDCSATGGRYLAQGTAEAPAATNDTTY
ncbi:MAG: hypothetical protein E7350_02545 [Clostridiales bacterium]|nr:hypothetical protein [Clostridiales bacterium]